MPSQHYFRAYILSILALCDENHKVYMDHTLMGKLNGLYTKWLRAAPSSCGDAENLPTPLVEVLRLDLEAVAVTTAKHGGVRVHFGQGGKQ